VSDSQGEEELEGEEEVGEEVGVGGVEEEVVEEWREWEWIGELVEMFGERLGWVCAERVVGCGGGGSSGAIAG